MGKSLQEIDSLPETEIETWKIFDRTVCPISDDSWLHNALLRHAIYQCHIKNYRGKIWNLMPEMFAPPQQTDEQIQQTCRLLAMKHKALSR